MGIIVTFYVFLYPTYTAIQMEYLMICKLFCWFVIVFVDLYSFKILQSQNQKEQTRINCIKQKMIEGKEDMYSYGTMAFL